MDGDCDEFYKVINEEPALYIVTFTLWRANPTFNSLPPTYATSTIQDSTNRT
jgi:hypothetical protein